MAKERDVVVIVVTPEQKHEETYKQPCADWYFIDAMGNTVFIKHKDKSKANAWLEENYGKNKYTLKPVKLKKVEGELSCRGFVNNKSRAGSYQIQVKNNQGRGI